jgi:histidyl-tRNA synthetase
MKPVDNLVKAKLLKGMQDSWPELAYARRRMVVRIEEVCRRFGFLPLDTPALESRDALLGLDPSPEQLRSIFTFVNQDEEEVGLRFDLTVPLARVVSSYQQEMARPLRRYQSGNVWRHDKPEPGRYREFMQFDIDMVGAPGISADAEIIAVIDAILRELEVGNYKIRISNRKLLNALGSWTGAEDVQGRDIYRVIDKLDKYDRERIRMELGPGLTDASGDRIPGLGLDPSQIARIDRFLDLPNDGDAAESIAASRELLAGSELALEALGEIQELFTYLELFGVPRTSAMFDLHLARGLGYYSGPVFEVTLTDLPTFGSIFGGGRYDGLVERFLGPGQGVPAVGASVGVDRLLAALQELGRDVTGGESAMPEVLVTVMDAERMPDYIAMTRELRDAGIRAELWQGGKANLKKQMKYADKLGIPLAVIAGSTEFEEGTVSIKDMVAGSAVSDEGGDREAYQQKRPQVSVKRSELAAKLRELLTPL